MTRCLAAVSIGLDKGDQQQHKRVHVCMLWQNSTCKLITD